MKNLIFGLILIFSISSCTHDQGNDMINQDSHLLQKSKATNDKVNPRKRTIFVLRHPPQIGNTCVGSSKCPRCTCPLGACICRKLRLSSPGEVLDYDEGHALMEVDINTDKVTLIFEQPTAMDDGTIDIYGDWNVETELSNEFALNEIILLQGIYTVDFSENEFGKIVIDAILN